MEKIIENIILRIEERSSIPQQIDWFFICNIPVKMVPLCVGTSTSPPPFDADKEKEEKENEGDFSDSEILCREFAGYLRSLRYKKLRARV